MLLLIVKFVFGPFQTNEFEGGDNSTNPKREKSNRNCLVGFKHEQHFCSPIKIHCGKSWSTTTSSMSSFNDGDDDAEMITIIIITSPSQNGLLNPQFYGQ